MPPATTSACQRVEPGCSSRPRGDRPAGARDHAARLAAAIGRSLDAADVRLITDEPGQAALWRIREDGAGHSSRLAGGVAAWPGFEDSAVPPERLGGYLRDAARAAPRARPAGHQLRPLRRGLHPPARRLRPGPRRRRGALPRLHGGRGRPRRGPRRLALRRARRRPCPRCAAGAPVQPAAAGGLRRLPGRLGPRRRAQPRDHRRAAADHAGTCAPRHRLPSMSGLPRPTATTAATSGPRSSAASASAAASPPRARSSCARASAPRATNSIPRAAGRGCSRR